MELKHYIIFLLVIVCLESAHGGKLLKKMTKELKKILGGSKFEDFVKDNLEHVASIKADITDIQANISANVADIETNNAIVANQITGIKANIAANVADIENIDTDIANNAANIASNAVAITNINAQIDIYRQKCATNETNYRMINNKCCYYETKHYKYEDAKQECETRFSNHGRLFEPKTWYENEVAFNNAKQSFGSNNWWVGINDEDNEGQFVFESDRTSISYSPTWASGYGAKGTSNNCILYTNGWQGVEWIDWPCGTFAKPSICEQTTTFRGHFTTV